MSSPHRKRLLAFWFASLAVMLVLAAALPGLTLLPERNYDIPWSVDPTGSVLDLGWLFGVMLALYVIGFFMIIPKELRRRLLAYAVVMFWLLAGMIVVAVWIAGDEGIEEPVLLLSSPVATPTMALSELEFTEELEPIREVVFTPPQHWVRIGVILGIGVLCAVVALGIFWFIYARYRPATPPPLFFLATQAQAALDALYGGEDVRDVVLRCYFEMARVLDQSQGIRRVETVTPREFAIQLTGWGLPAEPVSTLTRLFEEVRYGSYSEDDTAAQQAIASLEAIIAACQELA